MGTRARPAQLRIPPQVQQWQARIARQAARSAADRNQARRRGRRRPRVVV